MKSRITQKFPIICTCGRAYSGSYVYSEGVANPPLKYVHDSKEYGCRLS